MLYSNRLFCVHTFGFQGHHFMVATMPWSPYINMIPAGFTADGSVTYRMTGGIFAEVFDTLQVSNAYVNDDNDHLTCFISL